jgi:flagellar basal body-associated protein FliL
MKKTKKLKGIIWTIVFVLVVVVVAALVCHVMGLSVDVNAIWMPPKSKNKNETLKLKDNQCHLENNIYTIHL